MTLVSCQSLRARDFTLPKVHSLASLLSPIRSHSVFTWKDTSSSASTVLPEDMFPSHPQQSRRPEDQPFEEQELVYMFAEIIRQSRERLQSPSTKPASHILFDAIRSIGIDPQWEDLALPSGRSLRSCREVFHDFPRHHSGTFLPLHSPYGPGQSDQSRKRPLPADSQTPGGRILAPKPVAGPTGAQRTFGAGNTNPLSPLGGQPAPLAEPRKKRGRPSKKEQEERRLKLSESRPSESGPMQPYQPSPRPPSTQHHGLLSDRPSSPPLTGPNLMGLSTTPQGAPRAPSNSSSSGKRRRGRPPKNAPAMPLPFGGVTERVESYDTPPVTGGTNRDRRGSTAEESSRDQPTGSSGPPDSRESQTQVEAEESKQQPDWKNTILRREPEP